MSAYIMSIKQLAVYIVSIKQLAVYIVFIKQLAVYIVFIKQLAVYIVFISLAGLHPESHGMIHNEMWDPKHDAYFWAGTNPGQFQPFWWDGGDPLLW